jgi:hypothetical protein
MSLNRWISVLLCLSLFLVATPWSAAPGISSIVSPAKASELLPEGTRLDTLQWTQEYVQKIQALEIWESRDSQDAFQLVKRGDFARWLVKARLLPLKESKHTFNDLLTQVTPTTLHHDCPGSWHHRKSRHLPPQRPPIFGLMLGSGWSMPMETWQRKELRNIPSP